MEVHHNTVTLRTSPKLGGDCEVGFTFLKKFQGNFDGDEKEESEEEMEEDQTTMGGGEEDRPNPQAPQLVGFPPLFQLQGTPPILNKRPGSELVADPPPTVPAPEVPQRQDQPPPTRGTDPAVEGSGEDRAQGYFLVEAILRHKYRQGYLFLTKWQNFSVGEATWEPLKNFIHPDGCINEIFREYCHKNALDRAFRQALNAASRHFSHDG